MDGQELKLRQKPLIVRIKHLFPQIPAYDIKKCARQIALNNNPSNYKLDTVDFIRGQVMAYIRHNYTKYDNIMIAGKGKKAGRNAIKTRMTKIIDKWR